jgi:hypothetical protein
LPSYDDGRCCFGSLIEFRVPHRVAVEIATVVKAQIVPPHPKALGLEKPDAKVEGEATWTNFSLTFVRVIVHSLAFGLRLQLRLVTLDRITPIFGMELREGFEIL